ncbi:MAG: hypothetical protein ACOC3V_02915 [bacterium]
MDKYIVKINQHNMDYFALSTDYIRNFKKNCKSNEVSDTEILVLFSNIEMSKNNTPDEKLVEIIKKHRPNVYNLVTN